MIRFRPLLALLALACMLSLSAVTMADARVGGGFSLGSRGSRTFSAPPPTRTSPYTGAPIQRSMTQPGSPAVPRSYGGGLFGRPLLGGLAAGFLGAGLFGLLFGGGLFGGLGGIASLFGLLLQIALIVLVARFLMSLWQRRSTPAYAGPMGSSGASAYSYAGSGGGMGNGALQSPIALGKEDYDSFERLLDQIQSAYGREDLAALRGVATPEMLSYFADDLSKNASRGVVNHISDVKLLQGDLAEAWREGDTEYATVAMRFSLVDVMVDRASGRVVEGSEEPEQVTELWTFMRSRGGQWLLSAIQQAR